MMTFAVCFAASLRRRRWEQNERLCIFLFQHVHKALAVAAYFCFFVISVVSWMIPFIVGLEKSVKTCCLIIFSVSFFLYAL